MGQINVEDGMVVYRTLRRHGLRPDDEQASLIIGGNPNGDEDIQTAVMDRMSDEDLTHLREVLVNALTCVENTMEDRGFFTRYTTKDQG